MNAPQPPSPSTNLAALLGTADAGIRRIRKWLLIAGFVVALVLAAYFVAGSKNRSSVPQYQTAKAEIGRLVVTVSATGTLAPTNQVDVGSELSGIVQSVYVDDNSQVKQGQELARLDVSKLKDQVARSRAALSAAQAAVLQAEATMAESQASLARLREVSRLSGGKVPSKTELETAEASLKRAKANIASAHASVAQARATLSTDETNLAKASIRSPINGIVLARKVAPGQTVAASLQAPVLFTLAEDLREMELQVKVDEADVGQVHEGQKAVFSVDAYPRRKYPASIARVSYGATTAEGVVSYLTVLKVKNEDLSLRPGMTATAEITTQEKDQALLVPNAALRFAPARASSQKADSGGLLAALTPRPPRGTSNRAPDPDAKKRDTRKVYVLQDGRPVAVDARTGMTDGRVTEILGGGLAAGTEVIVDLSATQK